MPSSLPPAKTFAAVGAALALLAGSAAWAEGVSTVEVFVPAAAARVAGRIESQASVSVVVYAVDAVDGIQTTLSHDLPADPESAKRLALSRIEGLATDRMAQLQSAAIGLARASQYGLDRYPAVVFDGRAVVYGMTDLAQATALYDAWRERQPQ